MTVSLETPRLSTSVRVDTVDANTMYIGESIPSANESAPIWRIRKLVSSGTVMGLLFADGNPNYDNIWSDRASLS